MRRFQVLIVTFALLMAVNGNTAQAQEAMVLGKLNFVNLKEGEKPIMTGLTLAGNRCGSEYFNAKPYATEGVRCVLNWMTGCRSIQRHQRRRASM